MFYSDFGFEYVIEFYDWTKLELLQNNGERIVNCNIYDSGISIDNSVKYYLYLENSNLNNKYLYIGKLDSGYILNNYLYFTSDTYYYRYNTMYHL